MKSRNFPIDLVIYNFEDLFLQDPINPTSVIPCSILPYSILPCSMLPYSILPCSILPYSILPCSILPYSILPYFYKTVGMRRK